MFEEKKKQFLRTIDVLEFEIRTHTCTQMRMPTPLKDIDLIADVLSLSFRKVLGFLSWLRVHIKLLPNKYARSLQEEHYPYHHSNN